MSDRKNDMRQSDLTFFDGLFRSLDSEQLDRVRRNAPLMPEESDEPTRAVAEGDEPSDHEKTAAPTGAARIYLRSDVSPRIYIHKLTKDYGPAWLQWEEPETLWRTIERDSGISEGAIAQVAMDKIQVARSLLHQPTIFEEAFAFENAVQAWNDVLSNVSVLESVTPNEIIYFVHLHDSLFNKKEYGHEARRYIIGIFGGDGWFVLPPQLSGLSKDLDDYNLQTMDPQRLKMLKERLRAKASGSQSVTDNDMDPGAVQLAKLQKAGLYIRNREERESQHRSQFDVPQLGKKA